MKYLTAFVFAVFASDANAQQADPAFCYFEADGNILIQGRCHFVPQGGGSFRVFDTAPNFTYFANVLVGAQSQADGYWNGEPGANHAHAPLGKLIRVGGCWVNQRTRVCAWK